MTCARAPASFLNENGRAAAVDPCEYPPRPLRKAEQGRQHSAISRSTPDTSAKLRRHAIGPNVLPVRVFRSHRAHHQRGTRPCRAGPCLHWKTCRAGCRISRNVSNADRGTLFCTFAPCPLAAARFGSMVAVELDHEDFADFDATLANGSDAGPRGHAFYLPTGMLLLMPVASMRSSWASS